MDFKAIEDMIKSMDNSKLGYLEVNWHGISIKMRKQGEPDMISIQDSNSSSHELAKDLINKDSSNETASKDLPEAKDKEAQISLNNEIKLDHKDDSIKEIQSPIVGTFYGSSGPDKPPFVAVGSKVKKGDTLCIIEAMKLMNEIQSEVDGEIVEILVKNEEMVEYGQSMFKIKINS